MTLLCGDTVVVPVDKELPDNELENVINRAKSNCSNILCKEKKDSIKRLKEMFQQ